VETVDSIPIAEHQEIVDALEARIDQWVVRYYNLSEKYGELRDSVPAIVANTRAIETTLKLTLVQLQERVLEMEEAMRARFTE
jgi:hypothetical protein